MKILIRTTNWLGDAVMSIPALRQIRSAYPNAEITLLTRSWLTDLYSREDFSDVIIPYENNGWHSGVVGRLRLCKLLRKRQYSKAILLQNAFDAALITWLAHIPRRVGYVRDGRGFLLTDPIPVPAKGDIPLHERFYYLELLRRANIIKELPDCSDIRLSGVSTLKLDGQAEWRKRGIDEHRWIGVSPGAAFGSAKRWLPERFAKVGKYLSSELDAGIAIFGTANEIAITRQVEEFSGPRAHNLAGKTTLAEYIQLAATCSLYITNDSGSMHVAAALGIPTVAIFGATDDAATGPVSESARIIRHDVDCSPCLLRECPIDHPCMKGVKADLVVAEALSLLGQ